MMILTDFYIAFALLLIACAGLMVIWWLTDRLGSSGKAKIAVALLVLGAVIAVGSVGYYGTHLMDEGECPYQKPLVPCPIQPAAPSPQHHSPSAPDDIHRQKANPGTSPHPHQRIVQDQGARLTA